MPDISASVPNGTTRHCGASGTHNKSATFPSVYWGLALVGLWRLTHGDLLRDEARERLVGAQRLTSGHGAYSLACAAALRGHLDEAFERLEDALADGLISWDHVCKDADWDQLHDDERYDCLHKAFGP